MVLEEMLVLLRGRTKVTNNDAWLVGELNEALKWCWRRLYVTNPTIELTFGTTGTLAADAQALNLATAVDADIYSIERFWVKGAADTDYIPAVFTDPNDPAFIALDQVDPAQVIQPVLCSIYNFNQIRFGNELPSGTAWKADWIGTPPKLSLNTNCVTDFPEPLHSAITARAMGVIYNTKDDTRDGQWFGIAQDELSVGMKNVKRRQFATKGKTKPFPSRGGGFTS